MRARRHPPSPSRSNRAFTLVEVLVATLITAMILVAILGTLWAGLSGRDTVHNLSQEQSAGVAVLGLIEQDVEGLFVYNIAGKRVFLGKNKSVQGREADTLDLITTTNAKVPLAQGERNLRSDICEVGYRLRQNPQKPDFLEIWRRESFFVDDKPFEGGNFTLLYDQVKSFRVSYYAEPGSQAEEFDEWSSEEKGTLPYSMKIEMEVELRPRYENEGANVGGPEKRTVKFSRTLLFPDGLNQSLKQALVPLIPEKAPDIDAAGGAAGQKAQGTQKGGSPSPPPPPPAGKGG